MQTHRIAKCLTCLIQRHRDLNFTASHNSTEYINPVILVHQLGIWEERLPRSQITNVIQLDQGQLATAQSCHVACACAGAPVHILELVPKSTKTFGHILVTKLVDSHSQFVSFPDIGI